MSLLWVHVPSLGEGSADGSVVALAPEERRHVVSRRLREGDALVAFDGVGATAPARIERLSKRTIEIVLGKVESSPPPRSGSGLASAIPKGDRLSTMLPMLIQLGLETWQPLRLEESAVRALDVESARLQRIAIEGCKLARRPWTMRILPPIPLGEALAARAGHETIFYGDRLGSRADGRSAPTWVFIGPEAGFTPDEIRALETAGAQPRRFGPHNLRIETAAVAATVTCLQPT